MGDARADDARKERARRIDFSVNECILMFGDCYGACCQISGNSLRRLPSIFMYEFV